MFVLNHFYMASCAPSSMLPMSGNFMLPFLKKSCTEVNSYHEIQSRVELCKDNGNVVTIIAVDFMEEGDALKIVVDLNDPNFYGKYFIAKTTAKDSSISIDAGNIITFAVTAVLSSVISIIVFWQYWFKSYILPYYEIRLVRGGNGEQPSIFKIPLGGKQKYY